MNLPISSPLNRIGFTLIRRRVNASAQGFTLIELLIVMAIIGILVTMGFVSYQRAQQNARDTRRMQDLSELKVALESYFQNELSYPAAVSGQIEDANCNGGSAVVWSNEDPLICDGVTYMRAVPSNPGIGPEYCYDVPAAGQFVVYAQMENDVHLNVSPSEGCGSDTYNYKVESEK